MTFLFSFSNNAHAELSDCRAIEGNLERLNCYDLLPLIDEESMEPSDPTTIFEGLRELIRYQSDPLESGPRGSYVGLPATYEENAAGWATNALSEQDFPVGLGYRWALIQEDIRFSECRIYHIQQWEAQGVANMGRQDTDTDGDGFANVPKDMQVVGTFLTEINLDDVDASKTFVSGNEITMTRDAYISWSNFVRLGWRDPVDLLLESEGGTSIPTFDDHRRLQPTQRRSGENEFGRAYPEDQPEIKSTFLSLVNACQM